MKILHLLFGTICFLNLVNVIAGNGEIIFNPEEYDEENIEENMENEHFIQVVKQHNKSPHRIIGHKTSLATNSSLNEFIQSSFQTSLPMSKPSSYSDVNSLRLNHGDINIYNSSIHISSSKSRSQVEPLTPYGRVVDKYNSQMIEDDPFEFEETFVSLDNRNSDHLLSRHRRAVYSSGMETSKCEITSYGFGNFNNSDFKIAFENYLQFELRTSSVTVDNISIQKLPPNQNIYKKISFEISYPDVVQEKDIAHALYKLTRMGNFKIGKYEFKMDKAKLQRSTETTLTPVMCFLCKSYHRCIINYDVGFCRVNDGRLYPYEFEIEGQTITSYDEHATVRIKLSNKIPFGDTLTDTFYVSTNGLFATNKVTSFNPEPCKSLLNKYRRTVLAPYWTDLDLLQYDIGQVSYKLLDRRSLFSADDRNLLNRVNRDVSTYLQNTFYSEIVIIVTWSNLPPYPGYMNLDELVTIQLVLVSNFFTTYAIYMYPTDALTFNPIFRRNVRVCAFDFSLDFLSSDYYKFDTIIGNTGNYGIWLFPIGQTTSSRVKCLNWYYNNLQILQEINMWNNIVEPCPCNEFEAFVSFRWIESFLQPGCYETFPMYQQVGRRCCYRRDSTFENRRPLSGNFQLHTPYIGDIFQHERLDALPKQWCCKESDLCDQYYTVRPVRSCRVSSWWNFYRRAFFFGEPHIVTLDNFTYTFNGLGEYTLIRIYGEFNSTMNNIVDSTINNTIINTVNNTVNNTLVDFKLQGRTCRARTDNGQLVNATVFCALALQDSKNETVKVTIHDSKQYIVLFVNGQDYTEQFRDTNFSKTDLDIFFSKINDSLHVSTPDGIGISITLNRQYGLLDFSVELNARYKNSTKGLMGNFNDDPSDDLIYPNGNILLNTTSEKDIFVFGNSWRVNESIFDYLHGDNFSTFNDFDFVPMFLDDVNATVKTNAEAFCGGMDNYACVYDYLATGDANFAMNTKAALSNFDDEEKKLANQAPSVNTTLQLNVIVNETTTIEVTAMDPDNDTILIFIENPSIDVCCLKIKDNNTYIFDYTPSNMNPLSFGVVANDSKGRTSEAAVFTITICSGCSQQGNCNFDETTTTDNTYFNIAGCECDPRYSGSNCESDLDGCEFDPCPDGLKCTDIPASEQTIDGSPYNCSGDCPQGFQFNNSKCNDIDECSIDSTICGRNAKCTNDYGSYFCECELGFRKSSSGECRDIDECAEMQDNCQQICKNIDGSYTCNCNEGWILQDWLSNICKKNGSSPCGGLPNNNCSYGCTNISGVAKCFCEKGYKLSKNGLSCEDIDECALGICAQGCNNTNGSFICSCLSGFQLSVDNVTCDKCAEGKYGYNCGETCQCHGHATECHHVRGCNCTSNWKGINCSEDVDECAIGDKCSTEKYCLNTQGSYTCNCFNGYEDTHNNGTCLNVNECNDAMLRDCSFELCTDSIGSYSCRCPVGFTKINGSCEDIDECKLETSGCQVECENTRGEFNCRCPCGYILSFDRKSCIPEEKSRLCSCSNTSCEQICQIVNDLAVCSCYIGYRLHTDNKTCIDINECTESLALCTDICKNTNGSYNCSCSTGTKLSADNRTCEVCDGYTWGPECSYQCGCNPNGYSSCDRFTGCKCESGWTGSTCETDIDECTDNLTICPAPSNCKNTNGSYQCLCGNGFQFVNNTCLDINECEQYSPCDQTCTNTIGSYNCSCKQGFNANGDNCDDIDECLSHTSNCDQFCSNSIGSFYCECYEGYSLNTTTRNTCYRDTPCNCSQICIPKDGPDVCSCRPGYQLQTDNITCESCDVFHYGYNCSQNCGCVEENAMSCNETNNVCTCKMGWTGPICNQEIGRGKV